MLKPWPVELKRDSSGDILPGERSRLKNGIARLTDYYGRMGFETLGKGPYTCGVCRCSQEYSVVTPKSGSRSVGMLRHFVTRG